jgi:uncharacterized protein (DUF885 family)
MAGRIMDNYVAYLIAIFFVGVVGAIVVRSAKGPQRSDSAAMVTPRAGTTGGGGESARANALFEAAFQELVKRDPMLQTQLGIKTDYDKWSNLSKAHEDETIAILERQLADLETSIDYDKLDSGTRLSYDLFVDDHKRRIARDKYRYYDYPVNQMFGWHSRVAAFLINFHLIASKEDALAYVKRLQNVPLLMAQTITALKTRAEMGVIPPKFVFPRVIPVAQKKVDRLPGATGDSGNDGRRRVEISRWRGVLQTASC